MKNKGWLMFSIAVIVGTALIIYGAEPPEKFDPATFQLASGKVQFIEFYSKV